MAEFRQIWSHCDCESPDKTSISFDKFIALDMQKSCTESPDQD